MAATGKLQSVRREWRERDVRVVLAALIIAVATVATIALFASQLQRTLVSSASSFLAADRQLESETANHCRRPGSLRRSSVDWKRLK